MEAYYIYEGGELRTSSGKPPSKKQRTQNPHDQATLHTTPFYSIDSTRTPDNLHTAPSLLSITIQLVTDNLHLVDSFVGFPQQIGQSIFNEAARKDKFKNNFTYLNLFSDAYGVDILSEIVIKDSVVLDKLMATYMGLHHVVKLDLGGCHIGDDHPLIAHIAQDFLSLNHLGLADNGLTSDAVRRLCMPCKMFSRGPSALRVLDLSRNPYLNPVTFKYLRCFRQLQLVDVSGNILMKDAVHKLENFSVQEHKPGWYKDVSGAEGWAKQVVTDYIEQHTPNPSTAGTGFYGKKQKAARRPFRKNSDKPSLVLIATLPCGDKKAAVRDKTHSTNNSQEKLTKAMTHSAKINTQEKSTKGKSHSAKINTQEKSTKSKSHSANINTNKSKPRVEKDWSECEDDEDMQSVLQGYL